MTRMRIDANRETQIMTSISRPVRLFMIILSVYAGKAAAHEYYLMPNSFAVSQGQEISVRHRLGQRFNGNELPYIDVWNIRSETWMNGKREEVRGKDGDRPALKIIPTEPGLMSIVHESNIEVLTFETWEKFQNYAKKEGLDHALLVSEEGRKPKSRLKEAYARFAKTLVSVGDPPTGSDVETGLKIELVALAHPEQIPKGSPMPVRLIYEGQPLKGATVKVFVGIDTEFAHRVKTDSDGKVLIPDDGSGPYLLNAVHMVEPQSSKAISDQAHWESFWASLTFQRRH